MYPEFIAIYIGLGVLAALLLVVIILLAVVLAKLRNGRSSKSSSYGSNMVYCRNCAAQFNSAIRCCPNCGTVR